MTRVQQLAHSFPEESSGIQVDAAFITSFPNRLYLSGMKSSDGYVLVTREKAYCIVDFRYYEAATQVVKDCEVVLFHKIGDTLRELVAKHNIKGVLLEHEGITLATAGRLESILKGCGAQAVKDATLDRLLWELRFIKSKEEIDQISASQKITDEAFAYVLDKIHEGVTERELALEIEFFMKRQGAQDVAFDLIVVAGKKGSLCHGTPDENQVRWGDFITMDIGARLDGYHSDMTRTVALGQVSDEQKRVYDLVLEAQLAAIAAVKPGAACSDVDKAARDRIYNAGYEGCFGHATGHAVGLEIHEAPRFSTGDKTLLKPGMVMTVEPGVYLPGKFGVRIEDMVAVTEGGCRNLTHSPKELIEL